MSIHETAVSAGVRIVLCLGTAAAILSVGRKKSWIYRATADGGNVRQVAGIDGGMESSHLRQLDASADGRQLVFVLTPNALRSSRKYLYRLNSDGTGLKKLSTYGREHQVTFSPDGRRIAYLSNKTSYTYPGLHVMQADGSGERPRPGLEKSDDTIQEWSPDGKSVLFVALLFDSRPGSPAGRHDLHALSIRDWKVRQLTNRRGGVAHASYSPDGRKIAFVGQSPNAAKIQDLFVMNADGSNQRQVTRLNRGMMVKPVWTPDGKRIFFGSWKSDRTEFRLYSIDPDGGNPSVNAKPLPGNLKYAWISPSGRHVAYSIVSSTEASLHLWESGTGKSKRLLKVSGKSPSVCPYWVRR